jgi:hypothetical protein
LPTFLGYLKKHEGNLGGLDQIRKHLLNLDHNDVRAALNTACGIHGLAVIGASGLLALMYPETFGTVDKFVVEALSQVDNLPEADAAAVAKMKCKMERKHKRDLTIEDGVRLIGIMQEKALENNRDFGVTTWTPRKIDKVLWCYRETG